MIHYEVMTTFPKELPTVSLARVGRVLSKVLKLHGSHEVAVRFLSLAAMRDLNKKTMGKNRPTDVLAFPSGKIPLPDKASENFLGDLALCVPYAKLEAKRRSIALEEELRRLLIHGTLHLLGFDHALPVEEAEMFGLQEYLVDRTA